MIVQISIVDVEKLRSVGIEKLICLEKVVIDDVYFINEMFI